MCGRGGTSRSNVTNQETPIVLENRDPLSLPNLPFAIFPLPIRPISPIGPILRTVPFAICHFPAFRDSEQLIAGKLFAAGLGNPFAMLPPFQI